MKLVILTLSTALIFALAQAASAAEETVAAVKYSGYPSTRVWISPGAALYRNTDGFQASITVLKRIGSPLYLGVETGYLRWEPNGRADYRGMPVGQTTIPLLVSALYRFENDSGVYPYLGLSAGTAITRPDDRDDSFYQVAVFFRPGAEFEINRYVSITLEPRLGFLDTSFTFAPLVGLTLSL